MHRLPLQSLQLRQGAAKLRAVLRLQGEISQSAGPGGALDRRRPRGNTNLRHKPALFPNQRLWR